MVPGVLRGRSSRCGGGEVSHLCHKSRESFHAVGLAFGYLACHCLDEQLTDQSLWVKSIRHFTSLIPVYTNIYGIELK